MNCRHFFQPYGNLARLSRDWGYLSTVELTEGPLATVWYEKMKGSSKAVLRQARWSLSV